jgi:hypothetical protein
MSIEVERATIACGCCGAKVTELRRGRCWGCYTKWAEQRPVPKGATCVVCDERRRENLRIVELHSKSVTMCHICSSRTVKLARVPSSIDALRRQLTRDRRQDDRRGDGMERRVFPRERRVGDRRGPPRASTFSDTNPHFVLPDFEDIEIEIQEADIEVVEQTLVREAPKRPSASSR